jgi:hypothetical protein
VSPPPPPPLPPPPPSWPKSRPLRHSRGGSEALLDRRRRSLGRGGGGVEVEEDEADGDGGNDEDAGNGDDDERSLMERDGEEAAGAEPRVTILVHRPCTRIEKDSAMIASSPAGSGSSSRIPYSHLSLVVPSTSSPKATAELLGMERWLWEDAEDEGAKWRGSFLESHCFADCCFNERTLELPNTATTVMFRPPRLVRTVDAMGKYRDAACERCRLGFQEAREARFFHFRTHVLFQAPVPAQGRAPSKGPAHAGRRRVDRKVLAGLIYNGVHRLGFGRKVLLRERQHRVGFRIGLERPLRPLLTFSHKILDLLSELVINRSVELGPK